MYLNPDKVKIALARKCLNQTDLVKCGISSQTVVTACKGRRICAKTAGRIAVFLGVDVAELVQEV